MNTFSNASAAATRRPYLAIICTTLTHNPFSYSKRLESDDAQSNGLEFIDADLDGASPLSASQREQWVAARLAARKRVIDRMRVLGLDASSPLWPLTTGNRDGRAPGEATIGEATIDKIRSDPGNAWPPDIHIQGGREMLEQFVGSSWLDESLGPLLDEIGSDPQRAANTLTILTADHGAGSTGKGGVYEGGVRVPLLLHWPARPPIEASALRGAHYLTHLDLLPTLASLAGVPALTTQHEPLLRNAIFRGRDMSGVLWPSTTGPEGRGHEAMRGREEDPPLFLESGFGRAVIEPTGRWKLIVNLSPHAQQETSSEISACTDELLTASSDLTNSTDSTSTECYDFFNHRTGDSGSGDQWCSRQLHPHYYENVQLYDLESDPKELVNVAASHADRVAELSRLLEGHMARALSE